MPGFSDSEDDFIPKPKGAVRLDLRGQLPPSQSDEDAAPARSKQPAGNGGNLIALAHCSGWTCSGSFASELCSAAAQSSRHSGASSRAKAARRQTLPSRTQQLAPGLVVSLTACPPSGRGTTAPLPQRRQRCRRWRIRRRRRWCINTAVPSSHQNLQSSSSPRRCPPRWSKREPSGHDGC